MKQSRTSSETSTMSKKIRVYMDFKSIDKPYKIIEQKLPKNTRKGFTIVE